MARTSKKSDLLAAAGALIVRHGLDALTFDRLAAEAHVSKGGLLIIFPTRSDCSSPWSRAVLLIDTRSQHGSCGQPPAPRRHRPLAARPYPHGTPATPKRMAARPHALLGTLRTALPPDYRRAL